MSDRELLAWVARTTVVLFVALLLGGSILVFITGKRDARECADYPADPGVPCRRGAALVVEGGVALCRCPGAMP